MTEPLWCEVRQHYCRCHDFGKRCEEWASWSDGAGGEFSAGEMAEPLAHNDHPLRHFDHTCAACVAEAARLPQESSEK